MDLRIAHIHLANKWVRIDGISPDLKKVLSGFKGDNLFGYMYIDHTAGLTLEAVKLFTLENEEIIYQESPPDKQTRVISRLDAVITSSEIRILPEEKIETLQLELPFPLDSYKRDDLEDFRKEEAFHEFRGEGFPDDIQVLFPPTEKLKPELVWGRVEKYENNKITFQLLNQPHQNFGLNIHNTATATVQNIENKTYVVCKLDLERPPSTQLKEKKWWKFW
ncbi:hypothetical protein [Dokdonia sp.]|uniref:hypothetical protein n=1 Tax=Dokdonia sp. TaxID=2024995 RepID=UPI003264C5AC